MFTLLTVAALIAGAFSVPALNPTPEITPIVTLCTSASLGTATCLQVPIVNNGGCTTFLSSAFSLFNNNIGTATIPAGEVCTFFMNQNCVSFSGSDSFTVEALQNEVFRFQVAFFDHVGSFSCAGI